MKKIGMSSENLICRFFMEFGDAPYNFKRLQLYGMYITILVYKYID